MKFRSVLYAALLLGANAAFADGGALEALKDGDMKKLMFHETAQAASEVTFEDVSGAPISLADYQGKIVVLNFWATWCAPCRAEMPTLDALQAEFGGEDFAVVPIGTQRTRKVAAQKLFDDLEITHLPILIDPKSAVATDMHVMSLPVTVILDRDGNELARLMGEADWSSESAKAIVAALIDHSES